MRQCTHCTKCTHPETKPHRHDLLASSVSPLCKYRSCLSAHTSSVIFTSRHNPNGITGIAQWRDSVIIHTYSISLWLTQCLKRGYQDLHACFRWKLYVQKFVLFAAFFSSGNIGGLCAPCKSPHTAVDKVLSIEMFLIL